MTDRERIISLLEDFGNQYPKSFDNLYYEPAAEADYLIYHGVTVRKKGEWKEIRNAYGELEGWICECGREVKCKEHFCPACGADMRGSNGGK